MSCAHTYEHTHKHTHAHEHTHTHTRTHTQTHTHTHEHTHIQNMYALIMSFHKLIGTVNRCTVQIFTGFYQNVRKTVAWFLQLY